MNTSLEHPSLNLLVTDAQRDRAIGYLQGAFADGRLTAEELDARLGQALNSRTRRDLNAAFAGLVRVPPAQTVVAAHPAYAPMINQQRDGGAGRAVAGIAHLSSLFLPLMASGIFYAASQPGSYARAHAAKAFNFQLISMFVFVVLGVLGMGEIAAIYGVTYFALSMIGAVKGFAGDEWRNPVNMLVPCKPLDEQQGGAGNRCAIGR